MEPSPRVLPESAPVEGQLFVWGGASKEVLDNSLIEQYLTTVWRFDPYLETWSHLNTGESRPPMDGIACCACTSAGHCLYTYGGTFNSSYSGSLHQLDTATSVWTELAEDGPMKKAGCGMVAHGNKLVVFGGIGMPSDPIQPGSEFMKNSDDGSGFTNELHTFDLQGGECEGWGSL